MKRKRVKSGEKVKSKGTMHAATLFAVSRGEVTTLDCPTHCIGERGGNLNASGTSEGHRGAIIDACPALKKSSALARGDPSLDSYRKGPLPGLVMTPAFWEYRFGSSACAGEQFIHRERCGFHAALCGQRFKGDVLKFREVGKFYKRPLDSVDFWNALAGDDHLHDF